MVTVSEQYEAYPYPQRDPADESKRLIEGSPSHPHEIDHFLFAGQRDWSRPFRVLVAGGGTGDGLIMLAQHLATAGHPHQITYVDLSTASRQVAEARATARGLTNITFHTGSLLDAPDLGTFDYIDCCGVLHHLPDPDAGFRALRAALAPGGGMGMMVYAPHGRSGVYPLQQAFADLYGAAAPQDRLKAARKLMERLPEGHPFKSNPNLNDHTHGDAGFYDLLLHSQDRAYDVTQLIDTFGRTGWALSGFTCPALYDLSRFAPVPDGMDEVTAMATAERLNGTIRTHTAYVTAADELRKPARGSTRALIPHIKGVQPGPLAQAVARGQAIPVNSDGIGEKLTLPKEAAPLIAAINGRRSLAQIAQATGHDPIRMGATWAQVESRLLPWGMLLYSNLLA